VVPLIAFIENFFQCFGLYEPFFDDVVIVAIVFSPLMSYGGIYWVIFRNDYVVGASSLNLIDLAGIRSANRLLYDRFLSVERNYLVSRNNILNLLVASLYYLTRQNTVQHQESVILKSLVHLLLCWKRRIVQKSVKDGFTILFRSPLLII